MKLYTALPHQPLAEQAGFAQEAAARGYAGVWATENRGDPFLHLAAAARPGRVLTLGTGVTALLARHPVTVAQMAWELHAASDEQFILGVGTQLDVHLRTRYGLATESKHARLHEAVCLIREMWSSWQAEREPSFQGDFYQVTRCPPAFRPFQRLASLPRIYLLCVTDEDLAMAGRGFDGLFTHPCWTPELLARRVSPLQRLAGPAGLTVISGGIVATGAHDEDWMRSREAARTRILDYWLQDRYDALFRQAGVWPEIEGLRAEWAQGSGPRWHSQAWQRLYERFVCDAAYPALAGSLRRRHGTSVDGVFANVVSLMPDLLPPDVVTDIGSSLDQATAG